MEKKTYIAPSVEIVEVATEMFIAGSNPKTNVTNGVSIDDESDYGFSTYINEGSDKDDVH